MWVKVAKVGDFDKVDSQLIEYGGLSIALFKAGGRFYAMDGLCPHQGGPLAEGYVEGAEVICPWHAWSFDLKTGFCTSVPGVTQKVYALKTQDADVWIDV